MRRESIQSSRVPAGVTDSESIISGRGALSTNVSGDRTGSMSIQTILSIVRALLQRCHHADTQEQCAARGARNRTAGRE